MSNRRVWAGIDTGGSFHEVQVTGENGDRLGKSFRIGRGRAGLSELEQELSQLCEGVEVVYAVEAAQNCWVELVHGLKRTGAEVYLVSPSKGAGLRQFYHRHTKTDAIDAEAISRVPVVDPDLHEAVVSDRRFDMLRRLARQSWQLRERMSARKRRIMSRVQLVYPGYERVFSNRYCGASLLFMRRYLDPARARRLGKRRLGALLRKRAWGKFSPEREDRLWSVVQNAPELDLDYPDFQFLVNQDLDLLEAEQRSQQVIRERMAEIYSEIDPECRLQSVPGLGEFLAAAITAFIGEPGRYRSGDQVVALAGLCPRKHRTGGVDKAGQPITRQGDPTLRSCLYVAAEIARHYDPDLQAFYRRLRRRGKHHKVVICALAAKLLRRCFAVITRAEPYRVTEAETIEAGRIKKAVRASVSEVAKRLNDGNGRPPTVYDPDKQDQSNADAPRNRTAMPSAGG
jgi:transposase